MARQLLYKKHVCQAGTGIRRGLTKVKEMNIFKRLFNWIQSAPADFCYVTGEWGFQRKTIAKPAVRGKAQNTYTRRSPVVLLKAPVGKVAAAPVVAAFSDHDIPVGDPLFQIAAAQEQNTYAQTAR